MRLINKVLKRFGFKVVRLNQWRKRQRASIDYLKADIDLNFLLAPRTSDLAAVMRLLPRSQSQLRQDLFVLETLDFKKNGFFVEFGATNGLNLSNTYLLERKFGWSGVLAEPGRNWHKELTANRSCALDYRCVWDSDGVDIPFLEFGSPELSRAQETETRDTPRLKKQTVSRYEVPSVTLNTLLRDHGAPPLIDYLSLDTEGSELRILKSLDFKSYRFKVITVEHNFSDDRSSMYELLTKNGYRRVQEDLSRWDDWYVLENFD